MLRFTFLMIVVALFAACKTGEIDCPRPERVRLHKKTNANYQVLMARERAENEKGLSKAELRELQSYSYKTIPIEEWDCPRPNANKLSKSMQRKIRKNRKRLEEYYKTREQADTVKLVAVTPER